MAIARSETSTAGSNTGGPSSPASRDGGTGKPSRVARPLAQLMRVHRGLCRDLQRAEERAYEIGMAIASIERALAADATGRLTAVASGALRLAARAQRQRARDASLRAIAEGGVRRLDIRPRTTGGANVRADDGKWFELPGVLANLLLVLTSVVGSGADGFPVWQTVEKVIDQIEWKIGKKPSRRSVTQAVYRMRAVLTANGLSPYLLQVDRRRGLRFLVRRESERWRADA